MASLRERELTVERVGELEVAVEDTTADFVGDHAHAVDIPVHHLSEVRHSLEDAYLHSGFPARAPPTS